MGIGAIKVSLSLSFERHVLVALLGLGHRLGRPFEIPVGDDS